MKNYFNAKPVAVSRLQLADVGSKKKKKKAEQCPRTDIINQGRGGRKIMPILPCRLGFADGLLLQKRRPAARLIRDWTHAALL